VLTVLVVKALSMKGKEAKGSSTAYLREGNGTLEAKRIPSSYKTVMGTERIGTKSKLFADLH
jgi:hypothetical protein